MTLSSLKAALFHATGQHDRRHFVVGLLIFIVFFWGQKFIMTPEILASVWGFLLSLLFFCVNCYIIYTLCARRLKDMGRSVWAFTAMICLELMVVITTMFKFGGSDYFSAFAQYERKEDIPDEIKTQIIADYQAGLEANLSTITILFWIVPVAFILWLSLSPTKKSGA